MLNSGATPFIIAVLIVVGVYLYRKKTNKGVRIKNSKKSGVAFTKEEEKKFKGILKLFANKPEKLLVKDVEELLRVAEEQECLRQFKAWILKQDISAGARVRVELTYSLYVNKLDQKSTKL